MGQPRDTYRIKSKSLLRKLMEDEWSIRDLADACKVQKSIIHELQSEKVMPSGRVPKDRCSRKLAQEIERNLGVKSGLLFEPVVRQTEDETGQTAAKKRAA
jgi:ribosome-binding protein aMBF1 (putative translation factor)